MAEITPATAQQTDRQRWLALVVLCTGFLMIILDQTIVNVALPSIKRDLNFSTSGLAWVINAYLIAFGGLLLLVGRLGRLAGRRRPDPEPELALDLLRHPADRGCHRGVHDAAAARRPRTGAA